MIKSKDLHLSPTLTMGDLNANDIESMISAQRVMALKKYFTDGNSSWKTILDEFLCNVGGKSHFFL